MNDYGSKGVAFGDPGDVDDPRPRVMFVVPGGLNEGTHYAQVRMSRLPRVGDRVRLIGSLPGGVFVPNEEPGPGRKIGENSVLTGVVEAIEWTLSGVPDEVRVEIELRDVNDP